MDPDSFNAQTTFVLFAILFSLPILIAVLAGIAEIVSRLQRRHRSHTR